MCNEKADMVMISRSALSCVCASDFQGSLFLAALLDTLHSRMLGQILILQ